MLLMITKQWEFVVLGDRRHTLLYETATQMPWEMDNTELYASQAFLFDIDPIPEHQLCSMSRYVSNDNSVDAE